MLSRFFWINDNHGGEKYTRSSENGERQTLDGSFPVLRSSFHAKPHPRPELRGLYLSQMDKCDSVWIMEIHYADRSMDFVASIATSSSALIPISNANLDGFVKPVMLTTPSISLARTEALSNFLASKFSGTAI